MNLNELKTFIRLPAVIAATGLARATIYKKIKEGSFPAPIPICANAVAWDAEAIAQWQSKCISDGLKRQ